MKFCENGRVDALKRGRQVPGALAEPVSCGGAAGGRVGQGGLEEAQGCALPSAPGQAHARCPGLGQVCSGLLLSPHCVDQ